MELGLQHHVELLHSCNAHNLIKQGKQLHLLFLKKGIFNSLLTVGNRLVQMYVKCGSMGDARKLFDEMPQTNCFTWNTLIEGYMRSGDKQKSLDMFYSMPYKNDFSWNLVISGHSKSGDLGLARMLFDHMPSKNGVAWHAMIHGYSSHGYPKEALRMFKGWSFDQKETSNGRDGFVLASVVGACTDLVALDCGKQIHARIIIDNVEFDPVLASCLINMYGKCGDLDNATRVLNTTTKLDDFSASALITSYASVGKIVDARGIFNKLDHPCVVVWNSMISGYVMNNNEQEAVALFNSMRRNGIREDCSTISSVLNASSGWGVLANGRQLHAHVGKLGFSKDVVVACGLIDLYSKCKTPDDACRIFSELEAHDTILLNTMINVYSNCGKVLEAKKIFDAMPHKTLISWNSMIVGLSQNSLPLAALDIFQQMNNLQLQTDTFSLASMISACASVSSLERGEQCFARAIIIGLASDPIVCTSLIDLYCKCGLVVIGRKLFDAMIKPDLVSWNSMLVGYAANGFGKEALDLFLDMGEVQPNEITFMAVLSGCSHCGLVEEGRRWFKSMQRDFGVKPGFEHYSCMVDLCSRAGLLEDAMGLIEEMPFEADASMWCCVLRGCVGHGNRELGKKVAEMVMEVEPEGSGAYVQMCGLLGGLGDWEGLERVRSVMRERCVGKNPGISWGS